jgi:hypothetical protein
MDGWQSMHDWYDMSELFNPVKFKNPSLWLAMKW